MAARTESKKIDKKWLNGLDFRNTKMEKVKGDDGKPKQVRTRVVVPLTEDNVLDWKEYGNEVVIVAADGRKHRVKK